MIKGAIFDVDGTLLDSMAIWEDAGARYLEKMGIEPEKGLGRILYPMSVEEGSAYLKERYNLSQNSEQIASGVLQVVQNFYEHEVALKPGAKEFLKKLSEQGIPMAVATSSGRMHIEAAFERLDIDSYFCRIFTCSEVGVGKSKPDVYQRAADELGTRPEETYVFEDVLHAIRTAAGAGFHTVGVYDRFSGDDQDELRKIADIYLPDLAEFDRFWHDANADTKR